MKKILVLLFVLFLTLTGCSSLQPYVSPEPEPTEPAGVVSLPAVKAPVPAEGGSISISSRLPKTLNPLINEDATVGDILLLAYEPLVIYNENLKPVINDCLVDYANISADNMSVIVALKSGLSWSNDAGIDADDLIYSLNTLALAPETALYKHCINNIEGFTKLSDLSVQITFKQPLQGLLYDLMFPMIPNNMTIPDLLVKKSAAQFPVYNGIYGFLSYTPSQELVLAANEKSLREKPYISKLHVIITKNAETDITAFERSLLDAAVCGISEMNSLLGRINSKANLYPSTYYDFIGFNLNRPLFALKEVRSAVAMCLPAEEIISKVYLDCAQKAPAMIRPNSYLYNPAAVLPSFSLDSANNLLYSCGFRDTNGDNIYEKVITGADGDKVQSDLRFNILYNTENDARAGVAKELEKNLEKIGFSVELNGVGFDDYTALLSERNYDVFIGGILMSDKKPDLRFMLSSEEALTGKNYCDFKSEKADEFLGLIDTASTEAEYKGAFFDLQKLLTDELPIIGIGFREDVLLTASDIYGCNGNRRNGLYYDMNKWFIGN